MSSAPTDPDARRQAFRRRRMMALGGLVVVLTVGGVIVPQVVSSAGALPLSRAAGEIVSAQVRLPQLTADASAALAVPSALVSPDAVATLTAARDAAGSASAEDLPSAVRDLEAAAHAFAQSVGDAGESVLGAWSDAERPTEDALHSAVAALASVAPDELSAAVDSVTARAAEVRASAEAYRATIRAAADGSSDQPAGGSVDAQLEYLLAYADDYNSEEWGDYNSAGGDCVNFTSQGLLARGWEMNGTWRSGGPWEGSKAWVSTTAMDAYLADQGFTANTIADLDRVRVGDVGVFDWAESGPGLDHTMTVSRVDYTADGPQIFFASHNNDGQYRELPATVKDPASGSTMRIYSIP